MNRLLFLLVSFALVLLACGGGESSAGPVGDRSKYPDGDYGTGEGNVIANLQFTTAEGTPFSFRDVQRDEANRVMLVNTASGWCPTCIGEQVSLKALHEDYKDRGFVLVEAYFQDGDQNWATVDQVANWKEQHELPFIVVKDGDPFQLGAYYDTTQTPLNMVVDVDDMTIKKITVGFHEEQLRAVIEANLPEE